jgi:hypothetical protein
MKVIFPVEQYKRWQAYVNAVHTEISGLGKIRQITPEAILVEEIKIFEQVVSGGHTILDKEARTRFDDEQMQKGDNLAGWKLWWHSHAFMDSYFSRQDEMTIEDWDNESNKNNWLLSIVTNKKQQTKIRLDVFSPLRLTITDIPFEISYEDDMLEAQIHLEVTQKVTQYRPRGRHLPAKVQNPPFTVSKKR